MLLNNTLELGEKLYPTTSPDGQKIIQMQCEELQKALDGLYCGIASTDGEIKRKMSQMKSVDECIEKITGWLKEVRNELSQDFILRSTLDEKRAQLQTYRTLLHDAVAHEQDIKDLRCKIDGFPDTNETFNKQLKDITEEHRKLLSRAEQFVERYEAIVSDHQQYSKAVQDANEWMDATHNTVAMWGDTELERTSLYSNMDRLKVG